MLSGFLNVFVIGNHSHVTEAVDRDLKPYLVIGFLDLFLGCCTWYPENLVKVLFITISGTNVEWQPWQYMMRVSTCKHIKQENVSSSCKIQPPNKHYVNWNSPYMNNYLLIQSLNNLFFSLNTRMMMKNRLDVLNVFMPFCGQDQHPSYYWHKTVRSAPLHVVQQTGERRPLTRHFLINKQLVHVNYVRDFNDFNRLWTCVCCKNELQSAEFCTLSCLSHC